MKIVMFDFVGLLSIQKRLLDEGNELSVCYLYNFLSNPQYNIKTDNEMFIGKKLNIVLSEKDVTKAISECDFILFEDTNKSPTRVRSYIEKISKKYNKPVINYANDYCFKFEEDRKYAKQFDYGFDTYKTYLCKNYKEFKKLGLNKKYVLKAFNEYSPYIKSDFRTIVPSSFEELDMILKEDKYNHFKSGGAVLEEFIDGVEIELAFYWNGNDIVGDVLVDQEYKGVWNGDLGHLLCGESGTVLKFTKQSQFIPKFQNIIDKCKIHFQKHFADYKGFIGLNTISSKDFKKTYLMEYTVRCGYPTEPDVCYMIKNYTKFLSALAFGTEYTDGYTSNGVYVGVAMFPYGDPIKTMLPNSYLPINGVVDNHILLQFGTKTKGKYYFCNSDRPVVSMAFGNTAEDANEIALNSLKKLDCWNLVYRSDIGSKWDDIYNSITKPRYSLSRFVIKETKEEMKRCYNVIKDFIYSIPEFSAYDKKTFVEDTYNAALEEFEDTDYIFVIWDNSNDSIAGLITASNGNNKYACEIDVLAVKPEHRGNKLATWLVNHVLRLKKYKEFRIQTESSKEYRPAFNLYHNKIGFRLTSVEQDYYGKNRDKLSLVWRR